MERIDDAGRLAGQQRPWWTLWLAAFVGWTAYALVFAVQVVGMSEKMGEPYHWPDVLRTSLVGMWGWVPLTVALFWLVSRFPIRRGRAVHACMVLMLGALAAVLARAVFIYLLDPWVRWYDAPPSFWGDVMPTSLQNNVLIAWIMMGLAHAVLYFDRAHAQERIAAELQARLAQARLDAIAAQLNPHFLFNALNSIAELVHLDADRADRMLVALSALLRRSLDSSRLQWVGLREELELLGQYLDIEKVRLGERMQVQWHVAEECLDEAVPPLLMQPLVENAIVHAIARRVRPGRVRIGAALVSGALRLEVEDDGAEGLPDVEGHGIGLANTRARLEALYGGDASLSVESNEASGTRVVLRLPRLHGSAARLQQEHLVRGFHYDQAMAP
jgi:signal transduction histidine kinase